jgi:hypothetical protein
VWGFFSDLGLFIFLVLLRWQAYLTGGIIVALLAVTEKVWGFCLSRRAYINVFVIGFLFVAFFLVWRDARLAHQEERKKWDTTQRAMSLIGTAVEYSPVDHSLMKLRVVLKFKNRARYAVRDFALTPVWAREQNLIDVRVGPPIAAVNRIDPEMDAPIPLESDPPMPFYPEWYYFYLLVKYGNYFDTTEHCEEWWMKLRVGDRAMNHQGPADKVKFEPVVGRQYRCER